MVSIEFLHYLLNTRSFVQAYYWYDLYIIVLVRSLAIKDSWFPIKLIAMILPFMNSRKEKLRRSFELPIFGSRRLYHFAINGVSFVSNFFLWMPVDQQSDIIVRCMVLEPFGINWKKVYRSLSLNPELYRFLLLKMFYFSLVSFSSSLDMCWLPP